MPKKNDNLLAELNQIKQDQQSVNDRIARIKQDADDDLRPELEQIERGGNAIISDIDDIKKQINQSATAQVERNTILSRMPKNLVNPNRVKIGGVWVG